VARKLVWASLALVPAVLVVRFALDVRHVVQFAVSAAALVPLAWVIGEATEHAAEHTGPRIGGLLNASFGNAPELIIALVAVNNGLPNVVRGSLAGSIVSNVLLVLGIAIVSTREEQIDRRSLGSQLGLVLAAVLLFLIPSVPGWHGNPDRHSLAVLTIPVAIVLLAVYAVHMVAGLRRGERGHAAVAPDSSGGLSLRAALAVLTVATAATALVSEILVNSLEPFAHSVGLSEFFIAAVIVAVVGNAAEHGGAIVIARRGKIRLASEIAVSSSTQVALLVVPTVALVSFAIHPALPLSFRPVELAAMGGACLLVARVIQDAKGKRWEGAVMLVAYAIVVLGFWLAGDR
jgi:Ca2+:H+ antiporter